MKRWKLHEAAYMAATLLWDHARLFLYFFNSSHTLITVVYSREKTMITQPINIYRRYKLQNPILRHQLPAWISVIHEMPIVTQTVNKLPVSYGTREFITALTRPHQFRWSACSFHTNSAQPVSWRTKPLSPVRNCYTGCVRIPGDCFLHPPVVTTDTLNMA